MMTMMNGNHDKNEKYAPLRKKRKLSDFLNELNLNDNVTETRRRRHEGFPGHWGILPQSEQQTKEQFGRTDKKTYFGKNKKLRAERDSDSDIDSDIEVSSKIAAEASKDGENVSDDLKYHSDTRDAAEMTIKIGENMFIDRKYLDPLIGINSNNIQRESKRIYEKIMSERMNSCSGNEDIKRPKNKVNPLLEGRMSLEEFQQRFREAYGDLDGDFEMDSDRTQAKNVCDEDVSNGEIVRRYYIEKNCSLVVWNREALDYERVVWRHWQRWMRQQLVNEALKRVEEIHNVDDDDVKMIDIEDSDMLVEEA